MRKYCYRIYALKLNEKRLCRTCDILTIIMYIICMVKHCKLPFFGRQSLDGNLASDRTVCTTDMTSSVYFDITIHFFLFRYLSLLEC